MPCVRVAFVKKKVIVDLHFFLFRTKDTAHTIPHSKISCHLKSYMVLGINNGRRREGQWYARPIVLDVHKVRLCVPLCALYSSNTPSLHCRNLSFSCHSTPSSFPLYTSSLTSLFSLLLAFSSLLTLFCVRRVIVSPFFPCQTLLRGVDCAREEKRKEKKEKKKRNKKK